MKKQTIKNIIAFLDRVELQGIEEAQAMTKAVQELQKSMQEWEKKKQDK